jgi:hypothetical protein
MAMTKKDIIELADAIRIHNYGASARPDLCNAFTSDQLDSLAAVCAKSNPAFMRDRWLGYIRSENGPNGGTVWRVP